MDFLYGAKARRSPRILQNRKKQRVYFNCRYFTKFFKLFRVILFLWGLALTGVKCGISISSWGIRSIASRSWLMRTGWNSNAKLILAFLRLLVEAFEKNLFMRIENYILQTWKQLIRSSKKIILEHVGLHLSVFNW